MTKQEVTVPLWASELLNRHEPVVCFNVLESLQRNDGILEARISPEDGCSILSIELEDKSIRIGEGDLMIEGKISWGKENSNVRVGICEFSQEGAEKVSAAFIYWQVDGFQRLELQFEDVRTFDRFGAIGWKQLGFDSAARVLRGRCLAA